MRSRGGFTLFELVLVVAIIGIIAAFTVPMAMNMLSENAVEVAGDMVRMAWAEARGRAVDKGKNFRFAVQPGTGMFMVAAEDSEYWEAATPPVGDHGDLLVGELPKEVMFTTTDGAASGAWAGIITFLTNGTAEEDAVVSFGNKEGGTPVSLYLRGLTGAVTSEPPTVTQGAAP